MRQWESTNSESNSSTKAYHETFTLSWFSTSIEAEVSTCQAARASCNRLKTAVSTDWRIGNESLSQ